jgi:ferritin-like metal-binding protein YciE
MKIESLQDLFLDQLRDIYNAEQQILKAMPKMVNAAHEPELQLSLNHHLEETREQINRLERVFEEMGARPKGKTCHAVMGIIQEAQELIKENAEPNVLDAGLIAAAQKIEHYEIACYGCLRTWAHQLGDPAAADLLQQTLNEEKNSDERLTYLAETMVNVHAPLA